MDWYILGSGPTVTYISPDFFIGKNVIATNRAGERLGLYRMPIHLITHSHYQWDDTYPLAEQYGSHQFYCPEGDQGFAGTPGRTDLPNVIHYPHKPTHPDFDVHSAWPDDANGILVGSTSLHGSMHLACKLGAHNLILVGADCGLLDNQANQAGYVSGNLASGDQLAWLGRWEQHLRAVKRKLVQVYAVRIYSLNPFLNLNLEGHHWSAPPIGSS